MARPPSANAALVLAAGLVFWGRGAGAIDEAVGEVCFNTAMTSYQEILTDPSCADHIITFTFPHIGNVGANTEDIETATPAVRGCVLREAITAPSSWRTAGSLDDWLLSHGLAAVTGIDTRLLTRCIHDAASLHRYVVEAVKVSGTNSVLLELYLQHAIEVDVDEIADGTDVYVAGVTQH